MQKMINLLIFVVLCVVVACLRPMYGLINSMQIAFFIGCMIFFIKGLTNFIIKKQGGFITYIYMLCYKLKSFVNKQFVEYKSLSWYKKPKYWLLLILLIFEVVAKIYYGAPNIKDILFQCIYCLPVLAFWIAGYAFPFILLLLFYCLYYVAGTIARLSFGYIPDTILIVGWFWFLVFVIGLITICLIIEVKRNQSSSFWKCFLKELGVCLFCIVCWIGVFYVQNKIQTRSVQKAFMTDCVKYNIPNEPDAQKLEQSCIEYYNKHRM